MSAGESTAPARRDDGAIVVYVANADSATSPSSR